MSTPSKHLVAVPPAALPLARGDGAVRAREDAVALGAPVLVPVGVYSEYSHVSHVGVLASTLMGCCENPHRVLPQVPRRDHGLGAPVLVPAG